MCRRLPHTLLSLQKGVLSWRLVDLVRHPGMPSGRDLISAHILLAVVQHLELPLLFASFNSQLESGRACLRRVFVVLVVDPSGSYCLRVSASSCPTAVNWTYGEAPPPGSRSTCCPPSRSRSACRLWCRRCSASGALPRAGPPVVCSGTFLKASTWLLVRGKCGARYKDLEVVGCGWSRCQGFDAGARIMQL